MSKFDKKLEEILGIADHSALEATLDSLNEENPIPKGFEPVVYEGVETKLVVASENDLTDDYKLSRTLLYGLIQRGQAALEGALMVAKESEHPRAYEVCATIMKTLSELSKDLVKLQTAISTPKPQASNATAPSSIGQQVNVQQNFTYGNKQEAESAAKNQLADLLDELGEDDG